MYERVKVLHAITRLDLGGSSENTLLSAIGLARRGYIVDVLFGDTQNANIHLLKEAEKCGVDFIEEADLIRDIHPIRDTFAFMNILHFIRDRKYDIVHAHSSKAGLICRVAARLAGVKNVIYTPHGHVFYGYFDKRLTRAVVLAEALASHLSDRIVGLTPAECDEWINFGIGKKEKYLAIASGIEFSMIDEDLSSGMDLRAELGIPSGGILVGSVGRFVGVKGYDYLVKAAIDVMKKRDDVYFVLAGDGPDRAKYAEMLEKAGVAGRFHLIGWQERPAGVINAMDIFVLSSLNEGMGRVLIEAMYMGKPVIATKVGGVPSVVSADTGILVEPASAEAISVAVERLADDPALAAEMGRKGRERAISSYSSEKMVNDLDALYRELLSRKGCGPRFVRGK